MLLNRKHAAGQGGVQVWQEPMDFIALHLLWKCAKDLRKLPTAIVLAAKR